jgi:hypothetical protein
MNPFESDPELDPDFDQELDALVPEAWADPLDREPAELLSFEAFVRDLEDGPAVPESCRVDPLQEAAAELALAQKRLDQQLARFVGSLTPAERALMDRRFAGLPLPPVLRAVPPPKRRPYEAPALRTVDSALRGPYDPDDPNRVVATCKATGRQTTASELARDWERALSGDVVAVEPHPLTEAQLRAAATRVQDDGDAVVPSAPGATARRVEALRSVARKNLGVVVSLERLLDDFAELRAAEPGSLRASEPGPPEPSEAMGWEPPSRRADEPPDPAALPIESWSRDPVGIEAAGARSCRWCRERVEDEFDHDFCEPRGPDAEMTHPELGGEYRAIELRYQENVRCAGCESRVAVELVAPRAAAERGMSSAVTVLCPCGTSISLAYHWKRRKVVGLRMTPPRRGSLDADVRAVAGGPSALSSARVATGGLPGRWSSALLGLVWVLPGVLGVLGHPALVRLGGVLVAAARRGSKSPRGR